MWINAAQKNPQFYLIWSFERTKAYLYVPHSHPHAQNAAHLFFFFFFSFSSFFIFVGMQGKLIFFLWPLYRSVTCDGVKIAEHKKSKE